MIYNTVKLYVMLTTWCLFIVIINVWLDFFTWRWLLRMNRGPDGYMGGVSLGPHVSCHVHSSWLPWPPPPSRPPDSRNPTLQFHFELYARWRNIRHVTSTVIHIYSLHIFCFSHLTQGTWRWSTRQGLHCSSVSEKVGLQKLSSPGNTTGLNCRSHQFYLCRPISQITNSLQHTHP